MAKKQKDEDDFKAKVMANPQWKSGVRQRMGRRSPQPRRKPRRASRSSIFTGSIRTWRSLATTHRAICRRSQEAGWRAAARLSRRAAGFAAVPAVLARADLYRDGDRADDRRAGAGPAELGPNDPFVKIVLNGQIAAKPPRRLVNGTKLADPACRKQLIEGGEAAVAASTDPMIVLARKLDPMRRELIKWNEDNVESVEQPPASSSARRASPRYGKTHLSRTRPSRCACPTAR